MSAADLLMKSYFAAWVQEHPRTPGYVAGNVNTMHLAQLYDDFRTAETRIRELEALVRMAWEATLDFRTTYNGRPSNFRESEIQTAKSLCDCNDALESFLYPEDSQSDRGDEQ